MRQGSFGRNVVSTSSLLFVYILLCFHLEKVGELNKPFENFHQIMMTVWSTPPQSFVRVFYQSTPNCSFLYSCQLVLGPPLHHQSNVVQLVVIQKNLVFVIYTQVMRNEREKGKWEEGHQINIENIVITREFRGRIWKPLVVMDRWQN